MIIYQNKIVVFFSFFNIKAGLLIKGLVEILFELYRVDLLAKYK